MVVERLRAEFQLRSLEHTTRRHFARDCATGLGAMWMAMQQPTSAESVRYTPQHDAVNPLSRLDPPMPAKAKRVIYLHMIGAPSQLELFDYKPDLQRLDGMDCPSEFMEGNRFAFISGTPKMLASQYDFQQHGDSGAWISDRLPNFAKQADKVCFVKSMRTDQFNHGPAQLMVHTGQSRMGYPSIGSWVTWGLGTENEDLPGFIVLLSGGRLPRVGKALWSSGFLASVYQGVQCRSQGDPVLNISDPEDVTRASRRAMLDAIASLNKQSHQLFGDPETLTRIAQYEMAFRMQSAVPVAMDIGRESKETLNAYGAEPGKESFANNCLLARRLAEEGVRFIQLYDWGWDSHGAGKNEALNAGFKDKCTQVDKPMAALLDDLDQRGMLEDTLVVWSGEFGRTPMRENRGGGEMAYIGRDHNPNAFTLWMAGGGVKPGFTYGETDPIGYRAAVNPVDLRDLHATMLRLLGLDHNRLNYPFQGLDQKLVGVKPARVIEEVIG
ncbi:MAG: DUF1501 domain-containing protein [Planctomycetota bacterium]